MLKYRVMTAIVLLLLIIAMMWLLNPPVFALTISIFFVIGAAEWAGLVGLTAIGWRIAYIGLLFLTIFGVSFLPPLILFTAAALVWLWAAAALCAYQRGGYLLGFQHPWVKAGCGLLLLAACWEGTVLLQSLSPEFLLLIFALCWLVDSGAFFAGKRWGSHALASRISPKKTWEGFWGGIFLAVAAIAAVSFYFPLTALQRGELILLMMICSLFAVVGDLFISLLKRQAGLKDSGALLPGHGGLLDRVDSAISAVPVFVLGFLFLTSLG